MLPGGGRQQVECFPPGCETGAQVSRLDLPFRRRGERLESLGMHQATASGTGEEGRGELGAATGAGRGARRGPWGGRHRATLRRTSVRGRDAVGSRDLIRHTTVELPCLVERDPDEDEADGAVDGRQDRGGKNESGEQCDRRE